MACKTFADILIREEPHYDQHLLKDRFPREDAWVGHVKTGDFPQGDGVTRFYNRLHRVFPDLSGRRTNVVAPSFPGECIENACDPPRKKIGRGSTQKSYSLVEEYHATEPFCWKLIQTADHAEEEFYNFMSVMRMASRLLNSNYLRFEAMAQAEWLYIATGTGFTKIATPTVTDTITLDTGGIFPTSKLTMEHLMRLQPRLTQEGYFEDEGGGNGGRNSDGRMSMGRIHKYKLITDEITGSELLNRNPALTSLFRFDDFKKGSELYKYGVAEGCGNWVFAYDDFPLRYMKAGNVLKRVLPYENVDATRGLKSQVVDLFNESHYQINFAWHPAAMVHLGYNPGSLIPEMPFLSIDYNGKWRWLMPDVIINDDGCTEQNYDHQKGFFHGDFKSAIRFEFPELVRVILSLREEACIVARTPCSDDPGYITQDYNAANAVCATCQEFDFAALGAGPYDVSQITCNGVAIDLPAGADGSFASLDAVVVWLQANLSYLGTWSHAAESTEICITGTCPNMTLTLVAS